ncbi:CHASE2 domain-containing protein, partial [Simkania negevensis]|nr:CHASE2 domain-containing protein [Simkania negevensis]
MVVIPWLFVHFNIISTAALEIPIALVIPLILVVLVNRLSFRIGICIVVLCAAFSLYKPLFMTRLLEGLDYRMRDISFNIRGPIKPTGQVVIVDIDNKSLQELGQWPWPRTDIAKMIHNILADGASVIGFDIVFPNPDRLSLGNWGRRLDGLGIKMELPGKTAEESKKLIHEENWQFYVPPETVKNLVFNDWEKRFIKKNSDFDVSDEKAEERERLLIEKHLQEQRIDWDEQQRLAKEQADYLGKEYAILP